MLRRCTQCFSRSERGLYFPINHRIVDQRVDARASTEADVQSRYRRELRSAFVTGETRQVATPAWSRHTAPSHFLSLRLPTRSSVEGQVRRMQEDMLFHDERVAPLFCPLPRLHVTLAVMTLPGECVELLQGNNSTSPASIENKDTNRSRAEADLAACNAKQQEDRNRRLTELLPKVRDRVAEACRELCRRQPLRLCFRGLGTFSEGRVLFVRCVCEKQFLMLDELVSRVRRELGVGLRIDMKGNPHDSFVPHITVAKIRAHQREEFGSQLMMEMWAKYQHHDFGEVAFGQIDLCSMRGQGADGYYPVEFSISLH